MKRSILFLLVLLVLFVAAGCAEKAENLRSDQVTELFPTIYLAAESRLYVDEWGEPIDGEYTSEESEEEVQAGLIFENGRISEGEIRHKDGSIVMEYEKKN